MHLVALFCLETVLSKAILFFVELRLARLQPGNGEDLAAQIGDHVETPSCSCPSDGPRGARHGQVRKQLQRAKNRLSQSCFARRERRSTIAERDKDASSAIRAETLETGVNKVQFFQRRCSGGKMRERVAGRTIAVTRIQISQERKTVWSRSRRITKNAWHVPTRGWRTINAKNAMGQMIAFSSVRTLKIPAKTARRSRRSSAWTRIVVARSESIEKDLAAAAMNLTRLSAPSASR